jgi:hypothetical protein
MSKARSFKYLAKQAELQRQKLVAIGETEPPETGGGAGVAAEPGALKFELINRVQNFSQKEAPHTLSHSVTSAIPRDSISPQETVTISEVPTNSILASFSPSAGVDTNLGAEGPGLEGMGAVGASEAKDGGVPVREAITEPVPIRARIYARPLNPKMRLIEFVEGPRVGEHGSLWIRMGDAGNTMLNWVVWVKPDVNRPTPVGVHWVMDGEYNWRGVRVK